MGEIRKNVKRWSKELREKIYHRGAEIYYHGSSGGSSNQALRMATEELAGEKKRELYEFDRKRFEEYLQKSRPAFIAPQPIVQEKIIEVAAPIPPEAVQAMALIGGLRDIIHSCVVEPLAKELRAAFSQSSVPATLPDFSAFTDSLERITARIEDAALLIATKPEPEVHEVPDYTPRAPMPIPAPEVNGNRAERKPKVLIIGNLTTQSQEATKRFPNVDIRYLDGTRAFDRIQKVSQNVDCTFVLQDYVSHKVKPHIKGDCVMIHGGASKLFTMIADRFGPGGNGKAHH